MAFLLQVHGSREAIEHKFSAILPALNLLDRDERHQDANERYAWEQRLELYEHWLRKNLGIRIKVNWDEEGVLRDVTKDNNGRLNVWIHPFPLPFWIHYNRRDEVEFESEHHRRFRLIWTGHDFVARHK